MRQLADIPRSCDDVTDSTGPARFARRSLLVAAVLGRRDEPEHPHGAAADGDPGASATSTLVYTVTGRVLDVSPHVLVLRTERGELAADAAIVCAGAWSKPLAASLGDRVPLETERGYHLMIRDPEVMPRIPVADADGKFVATPMDTGLRFAGTVGLAGLAAPPDWRRARILLEQGRRMLPGLATDHPEERLSVWMGHRPSLPDSLPALGRSRASPEVIYAFGHGHIGMTAAPMTGRIVADLVAGRRPSIDIAPFDPARFA